MSLFSLLSLGFVADFWLSLRNAPDEGKRETLKGSLIELDNEGQFLVLSTLVSPH